MHLISLFLGKFCTTKSTLLYKVFYSTCYINKNTNYIPLKMELYAARYACVLALNHKKSEAHAKTERERDVFPPLYIQYIWIFLHPSFGTELVNPVSHEIERPGGRRTFEMSIEPRVVRCSSSASMHTYVGRSCNCSCSCTSQHDNATQRNAMYNAATWLWWRRRSDIHTYSNVQSAETR